MASLRERYQAVIKKLNYRVLLLCKEVESGFRVEEPPKGGVVKMGGVKKNNDNRVIVVENQKACDELRDLVKELERLERRLNK